MAYNNDLESFYSTLCKYYTDETREIIAKDYWADIRMFSYKFEENI